MPLPKYSLQYAFSWSVYFSNRTESYSSQIEFAGPHGIICNFTFSYLFLSKTIGRKRLRTQSLVGADLGQLVYTYKRVVCVCLSAFYRPHDICPLCGAASEYSESSSSQAVAGGPARAARASMHSESTRAHAVQLHNEKIAALMPFKNKTVRGRACISCRIRNSRDFQKREKENQHATSQVQFTVCLLLECLLFESY